ncbi:MAG: protein-export chaperone SecB [Limnochordia bacterium]|nr:protein-export chaperone SecB [Limnochordia bacterium]
MDKHVQSTFRFNGYRVKNIQFYMNEEFEPRQPIEIDFAIDIEIGLTEDCDKATVILHSRVFEHAVEHDYPFSLAVSIEGLFSSSENVTHDELMELCEINGTATLFPFLRSVVADITRAANVDPLILPLVNVYQLIQTQKEQDGAKTGHSE